MTDCNNVISYDPHYLSKEDAKANFGSGNEGPIILGPNPYCQLQAPTRVYCAGTNYSDYFVIGKYNNQYTICIWGYGYYQYSVSNFTYLSIQSAGGNDTIYVVPSKSSVNCQYDPWGHSITILEYDSNWTEHLSAEGGSGADTIQGTHNADMLDGEGGIDSLLGMAGDDYLYGGTEDDYLYAGDGEDHLHGEEHDDWLGHGNGSGKDWMYGGTGQDDYYAGSSGAHMQDVTSDTSRNDFTGSEVNDTIKGGGGIDHIAAKGGMDEIWGYGGSDEIFAGQGDDTIYGGDDLGDWIYGEGGDDTIYGGSGNDCIVGDYNATSLVGDEGEDTIDAGSGTGDCVFCDTIDHEEGVCIPDAGYTDEELTNSASNCGGECAYSCVTGWPAYCDNIS